jgi:hypothetical protein
MLNESKRVLRTFAASILLAASTLVATPAPAQTGGWSGGYDDYECCTISGCPPSSGPYDGCCVYYEWAGGWYRHFVTHSEPCDPYGGATEPADRPSQEVTEPAGQ